MNDWEGIHVSMIRSELVLAPALSQWLLSILGRESDKDWMWRKCKHMYRHLWFHYSMGVNAAQPLGNTPDGNAR